MGFGDLASTAIMFIAVLVITAGVALIMTTQLGEITNSARNSQAFTANKLKTDVVIDHIYYNATADRLTLYIKNIGATPLDINLMSAYVDNAFFRVNSSQAPAILSLDTNTLNPSYLDQNEVAQINVSINLTDSSQYTAKIITQYDTQAVAVFTT